LLLLASLVSADLWYWSQFRRHTPLLLCVCAPVLPLGRSYHPVLPHALVVSEQGVWRIVSHYEDEAARIRSTPREGETIVASIVSFPQSNTVGLLAPVVRTYNHTMGVIPEGPPLSASELASVRSLYSAWLGSKWDRAGPWNQEHARLLARGDGTSRVVLWRGVVHDFFGFGAVVALLWSLSLRFGSARIKRRMERRQALIRAGLCPECRYNITGLPAGAACPECGENLCPS
jgi:hypothetical protein